MRKLKGDALEIGIKEGGRKKSPRMRYLKRVNIFMHTVDFLVNVAFQCPFKTMVNLLASL